MPSRFYDHQVHVQNHIAGLADRLHNTHAIGQRRNKHTVHHIDMKIFRASIFYRSICSPSRIISAARIDRSQNFFHTFLHLTGHKILYGIVYTVPVKDHILQEARPQNRTRRIHPECRFCIPLSGTLRTMPRKQQNQGRRSRNALPPSRLFRSSLRC